MTTLVKYFVDIEHQGGSNMYYEKYRYRIECAELFKKTWKQPLYRAKCKELIGQSQ